MMDRVSAILERRGLRATPQREEVYRALASTKSHPTAEELFQEVRGRLPGISLATVYNSLDAMCRRGLARKIVGLHASDEAARYDADLSAHVHFLGDQGEVRDVPTDLSERLVESLPSDLVEEIERRMGVRVDRISIELLGDVTSGKSC
jgi:Fur family peroxide stress response transcriptional regulator